MNVLATPKSRNKHFALPRRPLELSSLLGIDAVEGVVQSSTTDTILAEVAAGAGEVLVTLDLINCPTESNGPDGEIVATTSATVGIAKTVITLGVPRDVPRACYVARLSIGPTTSTAATVAHGSIVWTGDVSEVGLAAFVAGSATVTGTGTSWTSALVGRPITWVRVAGDLGGWTTISSVGGATSITLTSSAPETSVDGAGAPAARPYHVGSAAPAGTSWQPSRPVAALLHRWETT